MKTKEIRIITKALLFAGLLAGAAIAAFGQEAAPAPEFEAASIKPAEPLNTGSMTGGGQMQIRMGCGRPDPEGSRAAACRCGRSW